MLFQEAYLIVFRIYARIYIWLDHFFLGAAKYIPKFMCLTLKEFSPLGSLEAKRWERSFLIYPENSDKGSSHPQGITSWPFHISQKHPYCPGAFSRCASGKCASHFSIAVLKKKKRHHELKQIIEEGFHLEFMVYHPPRQEQVHIRQEWRWNIGESSHLIPKHEVGEANSK